MANSDLYSRGYVLSYPEGDSSLEREKIQYISDPGDSLHIVTEGETLTMLSTRFYGEPKFWYLIADCNPDNIWNPLFLTIGSQLIIPNKDKYLL